MFIWKIWYSEPRYCIYRSAVYRPPIWIILSPSHTAFLYDNYYPGDISTYRRKGGVRSNGPKSDFCIQAKCKDAFRILLSSLRAKYVIISYNDEALIKIDEFLDIIKEKYAFVEPRSINYVKYRGKYKKKSGVSNTTTTEYLIYASNHMSLRLNTFFSSWKQK